MYDRVRHKVQSFLALEPTMSFTTDIWSSVAAESYISLTGHFITEGYQRKKVSICCEWFPGEHTGIAVAEKLQKMLEDNSLSGKCHCVLRDSGSNMAAAFQNSTIKSVACLAHIVQNVVKDGLFKGEQPIARMLDRARSIVGHFRHSPKATNRFKQIQRACMPDDKHHSLIQSEPTRWNSDYFMLERLVEQREPVTAALASDSFASLRDDQWELATHVVALLGPLENITKKLSQADASISQVIPFIEVMKRSLSRSLETSDYLRTAREKMLEGIAKRTDPMISNSVCYIATVLDPRYKVNALRGCGVDIAAKQELVKLCAKAMQQPADPDQPDEDQTDSSAAEDDPPASASEVAEGEPAEKKRKTSAPVESEFDEIMGELLMSSSAPGGDSLDLTSASNMVNAYLGDHWDAKSDPLSFWKAKCDIYPQLAQLARAYLAPPPATVASERLFSSSGNICSPARNRLLPERLEMLVYLSKNIEAVNFEY